MNKKPYHHLPGGTFRNDYVFSVAAHMLNGLTDKALPELPFKLFKSFDYDDIHSVISTQEIIMYLEKHDSPGEFLLSKWSNLDLHVMNKWAINRAAQDFIEVIT